jgi:hypothetical protein
MTNPTTLIGGQLIEHIFPSPLLGAFQKNRMATVAGQNAPQIYMIIFQENKQKKFRQHRSLYLVKPLGFPNLKNGCIS